MKRNNFLIYFMIIIIIIFIFLIFYIKINNNEKFKNSKFFSSRRNSPWYKHKLAERYNICTKNSNYEFCHHYPYLYHNKCYCPNNFIGFQLEDNRCVCYNPFI